MNSHKLVPVFAKVNPLGTAPAQEACLKLTEDEQVFAAVGFFYFDAPACYVVQHDTPILGGTMSPDLLKQAKAPWMTLESGPEVSSHVIDTLAEGGALKGKLGIVALATEEKNLLDAQVLPGLKRNGIKGTVAIIDAPLTDVVAGTQQAATIAERFKSDGIKTVLLVGGTPSAFTNGLKNTDFRPKLVGTNFSTFQGAAINKATDPAFYKDAVTADIGIDFDDPSLQKCYTTVEKVTGDTIVELPETGKPDYQASAANTCRYVSLFSPAHDRRRQGPHRCGLRQGGGEVGVGDNPRIRDHQVRPEDPHVAAADVHLQVRHRDAAAGEGSEGRLTR